MKHLESLRRSIYPPTCLPVARAFFRSRHIYWYEGCKHACWEWHCSKLSLEVSDTREGRVFSSNVVICGNE